MMAHRFPRRKRSPVPRHGLARALSKLGFCSRSQAWELIKAGRAKVNGVLRLDAEWPVDLHRDQVEVDGTVVHAARRIYLMLNKPRGLVTTTQDEHGRQSVFECLAGRGLPFLAPVGRLDKASEGLLLFSNDTQWSARIIAPGSRVEKVYHVQVNSGVDLELAHHLEQGATVEGEFLSARRVTLLRRGSKNSWLEIVLDEGKNRHIRRLLAIWDIEVLRLVRVAIGPLVLGNLAKGEFRMLTRDEVRLLGTA